MGVALVQRIKKFLELSVLRCWNQERASAAEEEPALIAQRAAVSNRGHLDFKIRQVAGLDASRRFRVLQIKSGRKLDRDIVLCGPGEWEGNRVDAGCTGECRSRALLKESRLEK